VPSSPESADCHHGTASDGHIESLLRTLAHAGTLTTERITLPGTSITIEVTRPTDINLLLDQTSADPEQNLPYWAEVWPSGIALAVAIAQQPDRVAGRRVLELGCGIGITAARAVAAGAHLTVSDYAADALTLTRITTLRHTGRELDSAVQHNWRSMPQTQTPIRERFPVVLAADVLYERRDIDPLFTTIDRLLAEDGLLWLADPHREPAGIFLDRLLARGWRVATTHWNGPWPDPKDANVTVRTHLITRPPQRGT